MKRFTCFLILFLFLMPHGFCQDAMVIDDYEKHLERAKLYDNVSLYAECIEELNAAIQITKDKSWEEKEIELGIFLAEVKRKTGDFDEGISILKGLINSIDYPVLHVEKLGRVAALISGGGFYYLGISQRKDSVRFYLDSALLLAERLGLKKIQASLYNELGYSIGNENKDSSLYYLTKASKLFMEEKDTQNYAWSRINMLRVYETDRDSLLVIKSFYDLINLIKGREWLTIEQELYAIVSNHLYHNNDTNTANYWLLKSYESDWQNLQKTKVTKLDSYRILYETKKYKEEVKNKAKQLEIEEKTRKELVTSFSILLILSLGIGVLLFRERKLKKQVNKVNEKYHTLIVESNHRIKNNLQMIISMLEYSSKDLEDKDSLAFKKISGKIQTISALHKHLYLDVHNEKVDMKTYFEEIMSLYYDIINISFKIVLEIEAVSIPSERIVYFGLIFNEMLSNTIQHNKLIKKLVTIKVIKVDNYLQFTYQDHSSFDATNDSGTGIHLIKQLIKRVEGRNFKLDSQTGKYQFEFDV